MTSEIKTVFELDDIAGIEVECPECRASVLYPVQKTNERFAQNCLNCGAALIGPVAIEQMKVLVRALKLLAEPGDGPHGNVRIQIKPVPHK
ncbi:MAG TPA: hypothetical protein VHW72_01320 [Candidatus Angelobacter sp.]|nr:hypothetical protein [Candidatus Angelobacter sp.]